MNAICGILSRGDVDAPLAAASAGLHNYGTEGGEWTGKGVGLGFRSRPGATGRQALRFDMEAGLVCVADVRLDDRETLCAALGVPQPERAGLADGDLILRRRLAVKEYDEMLTDMNARQLANLAAEDVAAFTRVFREHRDTLDFFGYALLDA